MDKERNYKFYKPQLWAFGTLRAIMPDGKNQAFSSCFGAISSYLKRNLTKVVTGFISTTTPSHSKGSYEFSHSTLVYQNDVYRLLKNIFSKAQVNFQLPRSYTASLKGLFVGTPRNLTVNHLSTSSIRIWKDSLLYSENEFGTSCFSG